MGLTQWLTHGARQHADELALVFGDKRYTRAEFEDRVSRLAAVLRDCGVGTGDRVAMLANSSHRYIEYYYASLWAGGIMVPLNTRLALPEIVEQARDAEPVVLIVDESFSGQAEPLMQAAPSFRHVIFAGDGAAPSGMISYEAALAAAMPMADAGRDGDDVACLFYTGGTTGRAKGVMLSHGNLIANARNTLALTGFDRTLVHLHAGPLFHLAAGGRVFATTIAGGRHVVAPRFTPEDALEIIQRERITTATFVPTMLGMILQMPNFSSYDLSSLTRITYGASPMPEALLREGLERFPGVAFAQSYGMTELSPMATFLPPEEHRLDGDTRRLRSAGRAVPGVEVRVVDEDDSPLPVGKVGEIVARGPTVMKGYWRQPELTATALRGGWMHTGDAGYFDEDGFLYVVDRTKDMIVSGGENVYSTEVENAICRHPAVAQCAVIGIPDPKWGEAVHAIVVPRAGRELDAASVISHCRELIAAYKCPRSVDVHPEPLPLSSVNKINKAVLRQPFWAGRDRQVN
ncbi:long-chain-fatty-acid--CoA ligase [Phreatobacter stygius]|uniref:Long-chain-fatty-acid--CoA ligase n=1 Tax=Phreatobacter stygius TaxID=1940610 RepID=A0A4D7B1G7_9HYPH|nr:long-chain-fatty-acid--CoA ligase [Phreatobacter stygius]QCI63346.1 long-chain-fatty-acid--CoA ligase [Phreatobacter stygius]